MGHILGCQLRVGGWILLRTVGQQCLGRQRWRCLRGRSIGTRCNRDSLGVSLGNFEGGQLECRRMAMANLWGRTRIRSPRLQSQLDRGSNFRHRRTFFNDSGLCLRYRLC